MLWSYLTVSEERAASGAPKATPAEYTAKAVETVEKVFSNTHSARLRRLKMFLFWPTVGFMRPKSVEPSHSAPLKSPFALTALTGHFPTFFIEKKNANLSLTLS